MSDKFDDLRKPLPIESIDFRIQSINNGGFATILAYKDARVDMNVLDNVVGSAYWKREHYDNNTRCKVSVYNSEINEWVGKEDVGTESMTEKEKGLASDSFKRACFNWGIGRELYDYPMISIKLNKDEIQETGNSRPKYKATFKLNIKAWKWTSVFTDGKITGLKCVDDKGKERFLWMKNGVDIKAQKPPVKKTPELTNEQFEKALKADAKGLSATIQAIEKHKLIATSSQIELLAKTLKLKK